jgi:hypothetical protein
MAQIKSFIALIMMICHKSSHQLYPSSQALSLSLLIFYIYKGPNEKALEPTLKLPSFNHDDFL